MADPSKYERTYSFTDFQAGNPSEPLPGIQVDNELENVELSLNEAIDAINDVRRSDGALKNEIVTLDTLDPTVRAGVGAGALASAAAAAASADAASDSAVAAAASATAADGSATAASGYASNALTSRNEAEAERILAQTARTGAQTARDYASQWASAAEGVDVDDGVNPVGKSSYHWAQVALDAAAGTIADGAVTTAKLANGALSADTTGRAKMADGFVTSAKMADGILSADTTGRAKMADGFVDTAKLANSALSADTTGRAKMADGFVNAAKMSTARGETATWTAKQTFESAGFTTAALDLAVGQIAFPATQNPSTNANTLDDYEEGETTPTVTSDTGSITASSATLKYTKIGRLVTISAEITITSISGASGAIRLPLPFTASAASAGSGRDLSSGIGLACSISAPSLDTLRIVRYDAATAITAGKTYSVSASYIV